MPDERSEELLARLLTDPEFRARHRREVGRALETLELRESRQALLGALAAGVAEGAALMELAQHGLPDLGGLLPHVEEAQAATPHHAPAGLPDHVTFDAAGLADLRSGRIDSRVVAVLGEIGREHDIVVSSMRSDHPAAGHAVVKDRVNAVAFAPVEDFRRDSDLFLEGVGGAGAQGRIGAALERGFQTQDAELDLPRLLGDL